jgi:hypothetical protein
MQAAGMLTKGRERGRQETSGCSQKQFYAEMYEERLKLVARKRLDLAAFVMQEDVEFLRSVVRDNDLFAVRLDRFG